MAAGLAANANTERAREASSFPAFLSLREVRWERWLPVAFRLLCLEEVVSKRLPQGGRRAQGCPHLPPWTPHIAVLLGYAFFPPGPGGGVASAGSDKPACVGMEPHTMHHTQHTRHGFGALEHHRREKASAECQSGDVGAR